MSSYDEELKRTITELGQAFEQFKTENDAQLSGAVKDALKGFKLDELNAAVSDLQSKKDELEQKITQEREHREEVERKLNKLRNGGKGSDEDREKYLSQFNVEVKQLARSRNDNPPADLSMEEFDQYKTAWSKWARKGDSALTNEERKAMLVGSDTDGGFLVTPDMGGRMVKRVYDLSPIRQIASVQTIASDALEGIEDLDEADAGWVSEIGTRSDTDTPEVGKWRIEAMEMYAQPKATQKLLDDSSVDIEAWLSGKVGDKFARVEGAAFINGTGVGQPTGFATYTAVATGDDARAWGQLELVKTGANGAFHTTQADPLFDLEMAFKPHHLMNARWVTRRAVIAAIRKFKTTTTLEYIWQPGLQAGQPASLIGYPVTIAQDMPVHTTTGALGMAFGDFKAGYQIVDRLGTRVLRDPFTAKPYVVFYTIRRTGGAVIDFEAIKFIQFAS